MTNQGNQGTQLRSRAISQHQVVLSTENQTRGRNLPLSVTDRGECFPEFDSLPDLPEPELEFAAHGTHTPALRLSLLAQEHPTERTQGNQLRTRATSQHQVVLSTEKNLILGRNLPLSVTDRGECFPEFDSLPD